MSDVVYVIIRASGEHDSYTETRLGFVRTEEAAKVACERATEEGKTLQRPPWPNLPHTHGWLLPDGSWVPEDVGFMNKPREARLSLYPDAEARKAEGERLRAEYEAACLAMGCVDPDGPHADAEYTYEALTPL